MTTHLQGIAETKHWDERPYQEFEGGSKLTKATVTFAFSGEIEGEGVCEYLMAYPTDKSAHYVALQTVTGTVGGKRGSFVLQVSGTYADNEAHGTWFVVPGLGTGQLKTLRGEGTFRAPKGTQMHYTLDYDL